MDFKMNAVIHRRNDYENSLRTFQNKRMEYLEQEICAFDVETYDYFYTTFKNEAAP